MNDERRVPTCPYCGFMVGYEGIDDGCGPYGDESCDMYACDLCDERFESRDVDWVLVRDYQAWESGDEES